MTDAPPEAGEDPRGRRRPPILAIVGMLALAAPIALLGLRDPDRGAGRGAGGSPGKAAVSAPEGPRLATQVGPGTLALPGVVVDGAGSPIAGVTVTAELELGPGARGTGSAGSPDPSAPTPIAVIATTGADGRFSLAGMVAGRHRLVVEATDIFTAEVRFVAVPSDDIRIVVARRIAIAGRVVDGDHPVIAATVEIAGDAIAGRRAATTAADGTFSFDTLPEGSYLVWAWQGDLAARAQHVPRLGAGPFAPIVLVFEPAAIVVGHVIDRDGGAGVAAAVELRSLDDDAEAPRYARTGDDGVFRIEGVPHGRWTADAWSPGWVTVSTVEFAAGRGTPAVELVAGGVIEGAVVDDPADPVAGASVRATAEGAAGHPGVTVSADDAAERLRRYSGMAPALAAGPVAASPTADPRFVPRGELGVLLGPIPFPPPPGARVLRQASIVDDSLRGAAPDSGEPAALPEDPARAARWVTDSDGRFRITGLARGTVTVFATAAGYAEGASAPIATGPGRANGGVVVTLSRGTTLVGRVTDQRGNAVIGAAIAVVPRGNDDPTRRLDTVTDGDGEYRIGPLTGAITLTASAYAHGDARVEVEPRRPPAGATGPVEDRHDLVLVVADAELVGTVDDPAGLPVRGATVSVAGGPAAGRSAITGDGGFKIEMLPPGALVVRIDHPDYPPHEVQTTTEGIAHLVLPWGGGIDGLVIDHLTGAAIGGVVVTAVGPAGSRDETGVQASGAFELGPLVPGSWVLSVTQPGYLPVERTVDVSIGDRAGAITVRDVRIELERGALLAGIVRDRFGTRVPGVQVSVQRATRDGPTVTARTDADGEFRLRDVPTGVLVVRAVKDALAGKLEVTTAPGDEVLSLEIEVQ